MTQRNHIDGNWVGAGDGSTFEQRNPANLDEVTGVWPKGTREDARQAIEAAECIEVEYEELPAVLDIDQALAADAPILHEEFAEYFRTIESPCEGNRFWRAEIAEGTEVAIGSRCRRGRGVAEVAKVAKVATRCLFFGSAV